MAKSKLTPERQEQIMAAVRAGNYYEPSARAAGICEATLWHWIERGEADTQAGKQTKYAEFSEAIKRARAEAEVYAVAIVRKAMPEQWTAAMTFLERTQPSRWGRSEKRYHEHSGPGGGPIEIRTPDNDERRAEVARILGDAGC